MGALESSRELQPETSAHNADVYECKIMAFVQKGRMSEVSRLGFAKSSSRPTGTEADVCIVKTDFCRQEHLQDWCDYAAPAKDSTVSGLAVLGSTPPWSSCSPYLPF